jgi:hypothetical protein
MGVYELHLGARHRNPRSISINRARLEALIADAIEMLDQIDGDADDEPETDCCEAGDDGCGPLIRQGLTVWGSQEDEHYQAPDYGVDQTDIRALPSY